jgi:hypothetical protein
MFTDKKSSVITVNLIVTLLVAITTTPLLPTTIYVLGQSKTTSNNINGPTILRRHNQFNNNNLMQVRITSPTRITTYLFEG